MSTDSEKLNPQVSNTVQITTTKSEQNLTAQQRLESTQIFITGGQDNKTQIDEYRISITQHQEKNIKIQTSQNQLEILICAGVNKLLGKSEAKELAKIIEARNKLEKDFEVFYLYQINKSIEKEDYASLRRFLNAAFEANETRNIYREVDNKNTHSKDALLQKIYSLLENKKDSFDIQKILHNLQLTNFTYDDDKLNQKINSFIDKFEKINLKIHEVFKKYLASIEYFENLAYRYFEPEKTKHDTLAVNAQPLNIYHKITPQKFIENIISTFKDYDRLSLTKKLKEELKEIKKQINYLRSKIFLASDDAKNVFKEQLSKLEEDYENKNAHLKYQVSMLSCES